MASDSTITDAEEGKNVVDQDGETIGRVVEVTGGTAQVDPDPGITDTIMSKLGWSEAGQETYTLESHSIEHVTDDEIRIDTT